MTEKELGSLQKLVLFYLAENPNQHKKAIQEGIGRSKDDYGSVSNSVKALEKIKFITSKKGKSKKYVSIKYYYCTEKGVLHTLAHNENADVPNIFEAYKDKYPNVKFFSSEYERLGHDLFIKYYRDLIIHLMPIAENHSIEEAIPLMIMYYYTKYKDSDKEDLKGILRELTKLSPKAKIVLENFSKEINELTGIDLLE